MMISMFKSGRATSKGRFLEEPDVGKKQDDGSKESEPDFPADTAALRHDEHPVHRPAQAYSRLVECVVHLLGEG